MQIDNTSNLNQVILWEGKPEFKPYATIGFLDFIRSIAFGCFVVTVFIILSKVGQFSLNWIAMTMILVISFLDGLIRFVIKILNYKKTSYRITDKRVYIKNGIIDSHVKEIGKDKIKHIDTNISKIERKYNAGTILIWTGEVKESDNQEVKVLYKFESVKDVNEILRFF